MQKRIFPCIVGGFMLLFVCQYIRGCNTWHFRSSSEGKAFAISPKEDQIVFAGTGQGGQDLFLLNLQSQKVTQLTNTPSYESSPLFSPDGQSVVYAAGNEGERADHIFIRSLDGKSARQLTFDDYNDRDPAFSPDGKTLVFVRDHSYITGGAVQWGIWDKSQLYSVKRDGTQLQQLTNDTQLRQLPPGNMELANAPQFSPDGKSIVFSFGDAVSSMGSIAKLTFSAPRVANTVQMLPSLGFSGFPVVLPDNKHIAYFTDAPSGTGNSGLCLMDRNGRNNRQLLKNNKFLFPVLSPNGKRVYFITYSSYALQRIDIDGSHFVRLADATLLHDPLRWKPKPLAAQKSLTKKK